LIKMVKAVNFVQSWSILNDSVNDYNQMTGAASSKPQIQKIFSSLHFIILVVRFPRLTKYIYLGRGKRFEGMYLFEKNVESKYRSTDKFLSYLRKYLGDSRILEISCFEQDRILTIKYQSAEHQGAFSFFWKGNNLFFSNIYKVEGAYHLFKSWNQKTSLVDKFNLEHFAELGFSQLPDNFFIKKSGQEADYSSYIDFLAEIYNSPKIQRKIHQKLERKKGRILNDLEKNLKWTKFKTAIETPGLDLTQYQNLTVDDIAIKFFEGQTHYQRLDLVYKKLKKLKKGYEIQLQRLKNLEIEEQKTKLIVKSTAPYSPIAPVWKSGKVENIKDKNEKPDIDYFLMDKIQIGIGYSAKGNDQLRILWAKPQDLWFHIEGQPSAHVVVKVNDLVNLSPKQLELIGSILKEYSSYKDEKVPMVYSLVKNLKGVKGSPGKVICKKTKFVTIWYDRDWKQKMILIQGSKI